MEYIISNGELYHHGIKGQRWGVRRFQNKDGSLTSKGRKRYGSDKDSAKKEDPPKRKSVKDMSDEELVKAIARARAEDTYRQLRPEKVPAGKKFISTVTGKVLVPVAIEQGKNFLNKYLSNIADEYFKDKIPVSEKEKLTKENELLRLRNENKELKKSDDEKLSWKEKLDKQKYEKNSAIESANEYKYKLDYEKNKKLYDDWIKEYRTNSDSIINEPISTAASSSTARSGYTFVTNVTAQNRATRPVPVNPWDLGTGKTFHIKKD